ncbi:hypothetical protein NQ315_011969 [Exocentrus adspersus]|uniref:Transferrin-like domain-containing protein n=1 Tax=Exocentrus adspersus TaxID=1586481 RepID=A0AAV8W223_9CUCU|nr:hypothetical protein NQ315_011969 [Exocentrus adspersus]
MYFEDKIYLIFILHAIIFNLVKDATGQNFWKITQVSDEKRKDEWTTINWCTISREEQQKCENFAKAVERDHFKVSSGGLSTKAKLGCVQANTKNECMELLDQEKATLTTLDAGTIFNGGRYYSLVPISQEVLDGGFKYYYAVAVIKKGTLDDVNSLYRLRGKKACFAGVETFAGWLLPINTLMKEGGMEILDCNNHVKTATNYFGPSCAVNCLSDKYNPIGDNSDKLCQLCIGKIPGGRCTDSDPYAGYEGAFRCLLEAGEIAFLKHTTVNQLLSGMDYAGLSADNFQLLCKDGTRRSISEYLACNWGKVPSDAVVTSSAVSFEKREILQKFLQKFAKRYSKEHHQGNSTFNRQPDQYYNRNQPDRVEYGNQNRYKRQTFGNLGSPDNRNNNDRYGDPYRQDNYNNRDRQDNFNRDRQDNYNRDRQDDYNRDRDNSNKDYNPYNRDNQYNPYDNKQNNRDNNQYNSNNNNERTQYVDPYPHIVNPDQYGVNIDPYDTNVKIHKSNDPLYETSTEEASNQGNATYYEVFHIFESIPRYGQHGNLLFQDAAKDFAALPEPQQTYTSFLGESLQTIMGVRDCPVNRMTLCVTSDAEKNKCVKMRTALKAQLIKPEMDCYKGHSQIHCMEAIRAGTADVTVLDASDVYTAGLNYDLVPFISEIYNLEEPEYYVVAVSKESDPSTELTYLKNKYTCHGGINTAAGWVYPLAFLISNGWIRPYGCNSIRAAAEYFTKSCVPGAISTEYNTGVPYDNMCDLCHGSSFRYCRRDASEDYYGHTGAFRCLVEGGGHVAFVKHTTVTENTGGKKREWWARDNLNDDFELLCPDGTRAEINEYRKCNLGKVKANAIVTRGGYGYNETHINAYINLFLYAQTFYGRKISDEFSFSMFYSKPPYSDLIFQDATTQLKVIDPDKRSYDRYLGGDFLRARRIVDCHAGTTSLSASIGTELNKAVTFVKTCHLCKMSPEILFTLIYILLCACIIYPTSECISAGLTIEAIFSNILGAEHVSFTRYHIKKSCLNLFVYSLLPLVYVLSMCVLDYIEEDVHIFSGFGFLWKLFATTSLALPILSILQIKEWWRNNFELHPLAVNLKKFCNNNSDWRHVAKDLDIEYRELETVTFHSNAMVKVVVTPNWILKVMPLTTLAIHKSDASLIVKDAKKYDLCEDRYRMQFLEIEVKSARHKVDPFTIRISVNDFGDLRVRFTRSIEILPNVQFTKSVTEDFVDVFKETIKGNPVYDAQNQNLDLCLGCSVVLSNVKLQKNCEDTEGSAKCTSCYCRPMWCDDCMARWFVSKQEPSQQGEWLSCKATCPMCRATFCVLDVCLVAGADV